MNELRKALELAEEEEIQALTEVLFSRRFNPVDYFSVPTPAELQGQARGDRLEALERRFRYLAADGVTVLRGQTERVTYRGVLTQVCDRLKVPYSATFSTTDLEAEVFLALLNQTWQRLPQSEQVALNQQVKQAVSQSELAQQLPAAVRHNPVGLMLKGGSALAVSAVIRPWLLRQITRQFVIHLATYQLAQTTLQQGGAAIATQLQSRIAARMATRGMVLSAARYGAVRSLLSVLGPLLWTSFLADLGWRTVSTNYGRIIPAVFTLAQIRLTRSDYLECV